ncbi:Na-translocating system protein MpsC family protein [Neobacillus sp. CF12]|uniref:Na-translocating system protein MpsC family protein n=1 Tax=Neobacillus sp. CF12 TaxID=3055864 RepID=UPI0025A00D16|nr:Na-translocating system protein MpsC family protein [Neobacillus sp. CF12]MDM5326618.1 Na-translocating system protein MpsC family protein [Neobacillus sp. CF12]
MESPIYKQTGELSSYISKILRDHFGKGPESVYVSLGKTFIIFYIRNFLSPTEKVLMNQKQEETVQQTRDLVMHTLIPEIKAYIKIVTGMEIREFYYDWGLHNKSAMFTGICTDSTGIDIPIEEEFIGKAELINEIINLSSESEKKPDEIYACQLNHRSFLVIRNGILVRIEKQLIRQGMREQLKLAKRTLEKSLLHNNNHFERILDTKVIDIFVDWDFDLDKSVIVLVTNPTK